MRNSAPSIYKIDFYKHGHINQYPEGTEYVWVNWTPRSTRVPGVDRVIAFGLQAYIKATLQEEFNRTFFHQKWSRLEHDYKQFFRYTLGVDTRVDHMKSLHELGYLPLKIYASPEGLATKTGVPHFVMVNTDPRFFWLPNYLETQFSNNLWKPATSATTAKRYRLILEDAARRAGETDLSFVDWQAHDFSYRGCSGEDDAVLSGMGHLTSFSGTDTVPAIFGTVDYYRGKWTVGGSVPATEHSVMCAGGKETELETFRRLIEDVYSKGIVSIVSDTWDLWKVVTEYLPALKDKILARDGKVVIRPDSGDPVKIICGDSSAEINSPAYWGLARLLEREFPGKRNQQGYMMFDKVGMIYGDSITPERAQAIVDGLMSYKIHPYNIVFGVGSFTYEFVTRDNFGFAAKATAVQINGTVYPMFKDPVTSDGTPKKSLNGIPVMGYVDGDYEVFTTTDPTALDKCCYHKVFENGKLLMDYSFDDIRERVKKSYITSQSLREWNEWKK